jgi:hypothetical protein
MSFSDVIKKAVKANKKFFSAEIPDWDGFFEVVSKDYKQDLPTIAYELYE